MPRSEFLKKKYDSASGLSARITCFCSWFCTCHYIYIFLQRNAPDSHSKCLADYLKVLLVKRLHNLPAARYQINAMYFCPVHVYIPHPLATGCTRVKFPDTEFVLGVPIYHQRSSEAQHCSGKTTRVKPSCGKTAVTVPQLEVTWSLGTLIKQSFQVEALENIRHQNHHSTFWTFTWCVPRHVLYKSAYFIFGASFCSKVQLLTLT